MFPVIITDVINEREVAMINMSIVFLIFTLLFTFIAGGIIGIIMMGIMNYIKEANKIDQEDEGA